MASHGEPGTRRRGLQQTGVLMDEERRRYRNNGKDINISVDIYNNRQETRVRIYHSTKMLYVLYPLKLITLFEIKVSNQL